MSWDTGLLRNPRKRHGHCPALRLHLGNAECEPGVLEVTWREKTIYVHTRLWGLKHVYHYKKIGVNPHILSIRADEVIIISWYCKEVLESAEAGLKAHLEKPEFDTPELHAVYAAVALAIKKRFQHSVNFGARLLPHYPFSI